jgi:hypothetical protein
MKPTPSPSTTPRRLAGLIAPGVDAVKRLWKPFALIQLLAVVVVVGYFRIEGVREFCEVLVRLKVEGGFLFAACSMAIACGIVPELFKFATGVDRSFTRHRLHTTLFHTGLFAIGGVFADVWYRLLMIWPGESNAVHFVVGKVFMDMFGYTLVIGLPLVALGYTLRDAGYRPRMFFESLRDRWYARRVVPMVPVCWAYWFPICGLLYSLPGNLQLVFGTCAGAASSILLTAGAASSGRGRHSS